MPNFYGPNSVSLPLNVDDEVLMMRCPLRGVCRTLEEPGMKNKQIDI